MNLLPCLLLAVSLVLGVAPAFAAPRAKNKPPTVSLTSPAGGERFAPPATLTLAANAADADGTVSKVDFYSGTTLIGSSTAAPYSVVWSNVPAGSYSLTARATDNAGASATSSAVSITVAAPGVTIASPADNAVIYANAVTVTGSFQGDSNTTILVDNGNSTMLATHGAGNSYSANIPLLAGVNPLTVTVSRTDGTYESARIDVTAGQGPLVMFMSPPANCGTFDAPAAVTLEADAASPDGAIAKVDFLYNSTVLATQNAPPYRYVWSGLGSNTYWVSARATDTLGRTSTATTSFTVLGPNTPPAVSLTAPAAGATYTAPASLTLQATASDPDGSIAQVEFLQNGALLGGTNVAPYSLAWPNVAAGAYSLTARATDNRGDSTTSAAVAVSVIPPNQPPTVSLTSPTAGAGFTAPASVTLSANAADADGAIARIDFYQGATLIGSSTAAPYSVVWSNVPAGSYSLTARATDNLGAATNSAPVDITVTAPPPNQPPTVSLTAPAAGASFTAPASITLSASAADADGSIARVDFYQGATLIGSSPAAPYSAVWSNVPAGSYTLTARAIDNLGAVTDSAPQSITVNALSLAFSAPAGGSAIAGNQVIVSGSFQAPPNSGVVVNGVVAALDGDTFYAHLPLAGGSNTLTATLTAPTGQSATQSVTVTSDGESSPIRIGADTLEGIAPLTVKFSIENGGATDAVVQLNGGTPLDIAAGASGSYTVTYGAPGAYPATLVAVDGQGAITSREYVIVAHDAAQLDQMFKSLWSGMTNALVAGNRAGALAYLTTSAQEKYGPVFDALMPDFAQIVSTWSPPMHADISGDIGEYAVVTTNADVRSLFLIYFVRGPDGVWYLDSM